MFRLKFGLSIIFILINGLVDANQILFFDPDNPSGDVNRFARFFLIYPGTKWCGPGNVASGFDDLGTSKETDKCCRAHDNCDCITSGRSKDGLMNFKPFTVLNCDCDREFYECLQASKDDAAPFIGDAYFFIQNQCYRKDYPIKACRQYEQQFFSRCTDYDLDTTQPQKYQWFDLPFFSDKPFPNGNQTIEDINVNTLVEQTNNDV